MAAREGGHIKFRFYWSSLFVELISSPNVMKVMLTIALALPLSSTPVPAATLPVICSKLIVSPSIPVICHAVYPQAFVKSTGIEPAKVT